MHIINDYGFIYLWRDKKHKRFYIGRHWGNENDGYVCSSSWMKKAYKLRPNDFKRKIIQRIYTNKTDLVDAEYYWLKLIKEKELGVKYYNLNNHRNDHWSSSKDTRSIIQKIKENTIAACSTPEVRARYEAGIKKRTETYIRSPETIAKTSKANKGKKRSKEFCDRSRERMLAQPKPAQFFTEKAKAARIAAIKTQRVCCLFCQKEFTLPSITSHICVCPLPAPKKPNSWSPEKILKYKNSRPKFYADGILFSTKVEAAKVFGMSSRNVTSRLVSNNFPTWYYV